MATECGELHPDYADIVCDVTVPAHPWHRGWSVAVDSYVDWENPSYVPPVKTDRKAAAGKLKEMATRVASAPTTADDEPPSGFSAGLAGSEQAARRWTDDEKATVLGAIIAVARRLDEFTTDDIWDELAGRVPVTKGMTAMLKSADRKDILGNTGKTVISQRGGQHDHGQRLTVWYSLIKTKVGG
jgi:hypothetical protein